MKKLSLVLIVLTSALLSGPAVAGTASDALGTCMIDFLNGKERKELGKWVFLAMSAHPEIEQFANVSDQLRDESNQYIGGLIMRLLTEDCEEEASLAMSSENNVALTSAFELVGRVAMQELMTDSNVSSAIGGFEKYLDSAKLEALRSAD